MTSIELQDLIVRRLIRLRGGSARRWRSVIGPVRVYDLATHAHCNWSVSPSGEPREVLQVESLLDTVRLDHPMIDAA